MTVTCPSMMQILAVLVSSLALAASRDVPDGQCNQDGLCLGNFLDESSILNFAHMYQTKTDWHLYTPEGMKK